MSDIQLSVKFLRECQRNGIPFNYSFDGINRWISSDYT